MLAPLRQTVSRYRNAIAYAPTPGFPSRYPPGVYPGPDRGRQFHGPIPSPYIGVADGEGLGDDILDSLRTAGGTLLAPATEKLDRLEIAIKTILVFSGIAALTGVVNVLRR